jgi:hypothetical protein
MHHRALLDSPGKSGIGFLEIEMGAFFLTEEKIGEVLYLRCIASDGIVLKLFTISEMIKKQSKRVMHGYS